MNKNIKNSRRFLCILSVLSLTFSSGTDFIRVKAAGQQLPAIHESRSTSIKDELSGNGNLVTEYVNQEDQKTKTILWAKGITPPLMGGENSEFQRNESTINGETFVTYQSPYQPGNGWYDVNKTGNGDINLCFAAAAANSLHWWMDRNSQYIDQYLQRNPEDQQIQKLTSLRHSFFSQSSSGVFDIFLNQFSGRDEGYWSDLLQDQFINGYYLHSQNGTNDRPLYEDYLLQHGPDPHGGFFYKVMGTQLLSSRQLYGQGYNEISNNLKDAFMRGDIVLMGFRVSPVQSHVVTLWGAEYDHDGKLSGVYYTDSDDEPHIGMQRYKVINVNGSAVVSTRVENKGTNVIESLEILSTGKKQWDKYFADDKQTLELVWNNTEFTYDGQPHVPSVSIANLSSDEHIELVVTGEQINAGTYTATASFKEGSNPLYELPANPVCQFQIKKAPVLNIQYPSASSIDYGQQLSDSMFAGGNTEYGHFLWENGSIVPDAGQYTALVNFIPSQTVTQNYETIQNRQESVSVQVIPATPLITVSTQITEENGKPQLSVSAVVNPSGYGAIPDGKVLFTITDENGAAVTETPFEAVLNEQGTADLVWELDENQSYTVQAHYPGNGNYQSAYAETSVDTTLQNQQSLEIIPVGTKTYGDADFEINVNGGSGNGKLTISSSSPEIISVENNRASIHKAGTAVITAIKESDGLFASTQVSISITINKKQLSVIADDQLNIQQGDSMPEFSYQVKGLVNSDQFTNPVITAAAQNTEIPGEYEIIITGGQLTNAESYDISYTNGKLIISEKNTVPTPSPAPVPTPSPAPVPSPDSESSPLPTPVPTVLPEKTTGSQAITSSSVQHEDEQEDREEIKNDPVHEESQDKDENTESAGSSSLEKEPAADTQNSSDHFSFKIMAGIVFLALLSIFLLLFFRHKSDEQ